MYFDDFNAGTRSHKTWALASNLNRLFESRRRNNHVAADELFDFDQWSIGLRVLERDTVGAEATSEVYLVLLDLLAPVVELRVHRLHLRG